MTGCADVRPPPATPVPPTSSIVAPGTTATEGDPAPTTATEGEGEAEDAAPPPASDTPPAATPGVHHAFMDPIPTSLAVDAPAVLFANMSGSDCKADVKKRGIPAEADAKAHDGVNTAMRVTGAMHGVKITLPGKKSENGVLDCRMVLALDALAAELATMGVARIRIDNVYRAHAKIGGGKKGKTSQHAHGMALDITAFDMTDGRSLTPPDDWGAAIGDVPCGPSAVDAPTDDAVALRDLVCAIGRKGLFHTLLSPSFNAAHQSHFHFDLKRDDKHLAIR